MKTKFEVIQDAYGSRFDDLKAFINSEGVFVGDSFSLTEEEFSEWDFISAATPIEPGKLVGGSRPKELRGIEQNNGWISIDKELPTVNGFYLMSKGKKCVIIEVYEILKAGPEVLKSMFVQNGYTHWQSITIPKPPIHK